MRATGSAATSRSGRARSSPAATCAATSAAVSVPLNESGATSTDGMGGSRCGWGRCPEPVPEPAGSGPGRQSSTRTAARAPGQVETVTILKTAPVGSATLAIRPYGVSTAGSSTLPPSRSAAARAASVSGTPK